MFPDNVVGAGCFRFGFRYTLSNAEGKKPVTDIRVVFDDEKLGEAARAQWRCDERTVTLIMFSCWFRCRVRAHRRRSAQGDALCFAALRFARLAASPLRHASISSLNA